MPEGTCSVEGCEKTTVARGWCGAHYMRWKRTGDPRDGHRDKILAERFWAKVNKDGPVPEHRPDLGPCWLWTASTDTKGYAQVVRRGLGGLLRGHRFAYELTLGSIPPDAELDHLCRVKRCVNPIHLEPVTHAENMRRAPAALKTHCIHGHEYTPENTYRTPKGYRRCRHCITERQRT